MVFFPSIRRHHINLPQLNKSAPEDINIPRPTLILNIQHRRIWPQFIPKCKEIKIPIGCPLRREAIHDLICMRNINSSLRNWSIKPQPLVSEPPLPAVIAEDVR
jgi:hypothetical protein